VWLDPDSNKKQLGVLLVCTINNKNDTKKKNRSPINLLKNESIESILAFLR
jgi:hypothetical protein